MRPQKCPHCGSKRIEVVGNTFYCKKCHYINNMNPIIIRRK